jgi:hypothetical protein
MRRLFKHTDPDGSSIEFLELRGHSHALVLAAHEDGENATVNVPRAEVVGLYEALGRWLDGGAR